MLRTALRRRSWNSRPGTLAALHAARSHGGKPLRAVVNEDVVLDHCFMGSGNKYPMLAMATDRIACDQDTCSRLVADPVDPVTGARLRIPAPAGLPERAELRLSQWLDDGVFALAQFNSRNYPVGALVVCTVSEPGCEVAEAGPADWILPGREFYE